MGSVAAVLLNHLIALHKVYTDGYAYCMQVRNRYELRHDTTLQTSPLRRRLVVRRSLITARHGA